MKNKPPEGWKEYNLGEVAEFINGRGFKPSEWETQGKLIIRIQDLTGNIENPNYTRKKFDEKYLVKKGDLLISWSATLDAFIWDKKEGWLNQHIFKVVENKEIIIKKYLFYLTKTKIDEMKKNTHGSTMKHITKGNFEAIRIILPPLPIQQKIVLILEKAEQAKELRKEADELTKDFLKAVFMEMFGDKKKFEKVKIKTVVVETENENPEKEYPDKFFEYVDISSIDNTKGKIISSNKILGKEAPSRAKQKIKFNDLIISTVRPNLNSVALVPKGLDQQICSTGFCILRADINKVLPEYLYQFSRSNQFIESMNKIARGASYPAVSDKDLLDYEIPFPPLPLQQKFASIVKEVEAMKEQQKHSKEQLDNLFNVLMQKAFKGELI